jgi:hypothetical protein
VQETPLHGSSKRSKAVQDGASDEESSDQSRSAIEYYNGISDSLDLFNQNGVVCPNQRKLESYNEQEFGGIKWYKPSQWKQQCNIDNSYSSLKHHGLIVFKRGGSGSTWLDTLLDSAHPDIDFRHEAHTSVFNPILEPDMKQKKMIGFLNRCNGDMYCGFSISPSKHATGVDWKEIVDMSGARIVVFIRTNVIKRSLGLSNKQRIHKLPSKCKVSKMAYIIVCHM